MKTDEDKGIPPINVPQPEHDFTEPIESVDRLRRSEIRYRRLFETAQDGILLLDAEGGHIFDANPFLLNFLGYSHVELVGKQLWEIGLFHDIEANRSAFRTLKEKGFIRYDDLPLKTKQGLSREVEFVSNVYDVGDERVIQCNIRDVTSRKDAEKALFRSQESLRQSKKLEAMGRLSGGIAHDFNNMLTAINGYAGLALSMVEADGPLHDYLSQILLAGERSTALTRQLLAFSRQQILAPKILSINTVVSDMYAMLERLIDGSVILKRDLDPVLGCVKADLVQMQQILMNLVINARDSMSRGGKITIKSRNAEVDGDYALRHPEAAGQAYVMLSVSDTGTGMTKKVLAQAFDPFFTTKAFGKGTGMGLATVQGIVEQSGGHILVDSSPGKGSSFRIYLPRTDHEADCSAPVPSAEVAGDRGGEVVLLAEDETVVRAFVAKALEKYGYTVLQAANGIEALAVLESHQGPIHMLLTDLMMPNLNGRELAQHFNRLRPDSRVLFMSGHTDDIIFQQDLMAEGVSFIQKPFTASQLAKAMMEVLKPGVPAEG